MKTEVATVSKNGISIGDFVLMDKTNISYGRVIQIWRYTYEATDWQVTCRYGRLSKIKAGDEHASGLVVTRVLNIDLSLPKRKSTVTIGDDKVVLIDKAFIAKMFKKLNDTLAYVKMTNEQQGLI